MAGKYWVTIGDVSNIPQVIKDEYLHGEALPRVAFIGRSNVGKSSLINAILGERLAFVSKQPGKTKGIHFFKWIEAKIFVADLPGYGFAKTSKEERGRWSRFIEAYFKSDPHLKKVYVLMDSRRGVMDSDVEALEFFNRLGIPIGFVFTKIDQWKNQKEASQKKKDVKNSMLELELDDFPVFWISSTSKDGLPQLFKDIQESAK